MQLFPSSPRPPSVKNGLSGLKTTTNTSEILIFLQDFIQKVAFKREKKKRFYTLAMFNAKMDICVARRLNTSCYEIMLSVGNPVNVDPVHFVMLEWLFYGVLIAAVWQE